MIPELPSGISDFDRLEFYSTIAGNLSDQSTIHINWFTHRRNPSVCWFCDQTILINKLIELADKYITKPTVDLETELMSENETDTEIEVDLDEIPPPNEPEFDTEEEDLDS